MKKIIYLIICIITVISCISFAGCDNSTAEVQLDATTCKKYLHIDIFCQDYYVSGNYAYANAVVIIKPNIPNAIYNNCKLKDAYITSKSVFYTWTSTTLFTKVDIELDYLGNAICSMPVRTAYSTSSGGNEDETFPFSGKLELVSTTYEGVVIF